MYRMKKKPIPVPEGVGFYDLDLDQPYAVSLPADVVTLEGREEMNQYLKDMGIPITWCDGWSWDWVCTKDLTTSFNLVGTLPKRIAKYYKKALGVQLTTNMLQELGNIARRNTNKTADYTFEIASRCDWDDGDFGDSGSCFWGEYNGVTEALTEASNGKGVAVRFYRSKPVTIDNCLWKIPEATMWRCEKEDRIYHSADALLYRRRWEKCCNNCKRQAYDMTLRRPSRYSSGTYAVYTVKVIPDGSGYGRSWISHQDDGSLVLFNGYPRDFQLYDQARVLATSLGWTYKKVSTYRDGHIYLNGDSVLVSPPDLERKEEYVIHVPHYDNYQCDECGDGMHADDYFIVGDSYICERCYNNYAFSCGKCGESYWEGDGRNVDGDTWCHHCAQRDAETCENCGEYTLDYVMAEDYGTVYCEYNNCANSLYLSEEDGFFYADENNMPENKEE